MLLIILGHFSLETHWNFSHNDVLLSSTIKSLWIGGKLGVNLFVLISGYYLIHSTFKKKSFIRVWLISYFYSLTIYSVSALGGITQFNVKDLVKALFSSTSGYPNWFVTAYLVMYLLFPFVNKLLLSLSKKQFNVLLGLLTFISLLKTVFHNPSVGISNNDAIWLVVVYCFGAYIRLFERDIKQKNKGFYVKGLILTLFLSISSVFAIDFMQNRVKIGGTNTYDWFIDGTSTFQLFSALFIFILFLYGSTYSNKLVNKIASTTFAVYLIHANFLIVPWLWNNVVHGTNFEDSYMVLLYGFFVSITIFAVCAIIDLIRQLVLGRIEKSLIKKIADSKIITFLLGSFPGAS